MKVLFIHQNFPGQYRHLFAALAGAANHEVVAIGEEGALRRHYGDARLPARTALLGYCAPPPPGNTVHGYLRGLEAATRRGQQVARRMLQLRRQGFVPDTICVHPGWGEALFIRDVFPEARLVAFCEFYYRSRGADLGFDPEYPSDLDTRLRLRLKNAPLNQALLDCDLGIVPTHWQKRAHPAEFVDKLEVVHDGIDTDRVRPDPEARFVLPDGTSLRPGDPLVTFVNRNLEPYRGFHVFMRALPTLQRLCPQARVAIVGGDGVSYGQPVPGGYRQALLRELDGRLDLSRIHFLGCLPYGDYLRLLQVSAAHVYLTYPFVLSWSLLEAMAAGCLVIGSDTPPVTEVLEEGGNGRLVDFFDSEALAVRTAEVLQDPRRFEPLRQAARRTVVERYDLRRVCLPRQLALLPPLN